MYVKREHYIIPINKFFCRELKVKEDEKNKLLKRLKSSEDAGRNLNMRAISLEAQLVDREVALENMQAAYNSQL